MFVDIHVEPYEIKKQVEYTIEFPEYGKFPIMQINRGSYIAGAKIETSLNFHVSDGCYNLQIGKYCAMAEDILFMMDLMHDYKYVSMGAIEELKGIHNPIEKYERYRVQRKGQILIENDVWIGHGATIMGGVIIHNGAVIGANAVVTKDVPPYAIVVRNPARIIKYRFDEETIKSLLKIRWWDWTPELIKTRQKEMLFSAEKFVSAFGEDETGIAQNPIKKNVDGPVYACIADIDSKFPVFPKILDEFCHRYSSMNGQLVIYIRNDDSKECNLQGILQCLSDYQDVNCSIQIIDDAAVSIEDVIGNTDFYITNRCSENLKAVEFAYNYSKRILSGVDIPIWKQ